MPVVFAVFSFLLGAVIGSFLNVCVWRIPNGMSLGGRSRCTSCGHQLGWYDLFPIFSWVFLGGKCRYCREPISPRYMLGELLTAVCFTLCWLRFGLSVGTLLTMALAAVLIVLAFIDFDTREIPDRLPVAIAVLGVINVFFSGLKWYEHLIGAVVVALPFLIAALLGGMGGGDVKLMAAAGLFLGWKCALLSLLVACVAGLVAVIILAVCRKLKQNRVIAFGPLLSLGIFVSALCGNQIIDWYLSLFAKA